MKFNYSQEKKAEEFSDEVNVICKLLLECARMNDNHDPLAYACAFIKMALGSLSALEMPFDQVEALMNAMKEDYKLLEKGKQDADD